MLKLYANQLGASLKKQLAPVYLVFGEEPLQKLESLDEIRVAARNQGFTERQSYLLEAQLDWDSLFGEFNSLSLFSDRKLIELDLGTSKITPAQQDQLKKSRRCYMQMCAWCCMPRATAANLIKPAGLKPCLNKACRCSFIRSMTRSLCAG